MRTVVRKPGTEETSTVPPIFSMFVFDDVHSDAASGPIANVFGGGKAGMKQQIGRLAIAHWFALFRANQTAFDGVCA